MRRRPTGWSRSRSAASRSRPPPSTCFWDKQPDQHHRHPRPRRLHGRGGALAARPRRRRRRLRRQGGRRAPVRDRVASGRQVRRPPHLLRQQDGQARRRLLLHRRQTIKDRLGAEPLVIQLPIGSESDFVGVVDLVEMRALVWPGDAKGDVTMGAKYEIEEIPADLQEKAERVPPRARSRRVAETDDALHGEVPRWRGADASPRSRARSASSPSTPSSTRSCAARRSRTAACSRCSTPSSTTCRPRSTSPPIDGHDAERRGDRDRPRKPDANEPFSALAFKVAVAPVLRHAHLHPRLLRPDRLRVPQVVNSTKGKKERIGKIFQMHANKENPVDERHRRPHLRGHRPQGHHHR